MEMYVAGKWQNGQSMAAVKSPWTGETVDEVPDATDAQVEAALAAAVQGAKAMRALSGYECYQIMMRAADIVAREAEDLAQTITREQGKPISESRGEMSRMPDLLRLCAFEGTQMRGETLPVDAQNGGQGKMGMTLRVPCGIIVAISPF